MASSPNQSSFSGNLREPPTPPVTADVLAGLPSRVADSSLPALTYEAYPGAATRGSHLAYRRRQPEKTALHLVVREHLETFLERARLGDGECYPRFVEKEFRRYLDCGLLCHGFARLRCPDCGFERLVAFSCKGRLCPSCLGRRMAAWPTPPPTWWMSFFRWPPTASGS